MSLAPQIEPAQILFHRAQNPLGGSPSGPGSWLEAATAGYGLELDIRDQNGELLLEHDPVPASRASIRFSNLIATLQERKLTPVLALNIKSDGLCDLLQQALQDYPRESIFCFDMSIPDSLGYRDAHLPWYSRISDLEPGTRFTESNETGVWLDSFETTWFNPEIIVELARHFTRIAIVSAELHSRDIKETSDLLRRLPPDILQKLLICTDHPSHYLT